MELLRKGGEVHKSQSSSWQPPEVVSGNPEKVCNVLDFQQDVGCKISTVLLNTERMIPQSWKNIIYKNINLIGKNSLQSSLKFNIIW